MMISGVFLRCSKSNFSNLTSVEVTVDGGRVFIETTVVSFAGGQVVPE